jgi:hypothetical protein
VRWVLIRAVLPTKIIAVFRSHLFSGVTLPGQLDHNQLENPKMVDVGLG